MRLKIDHDISGGGCSMYGWRVENVELT
jgi:hypothetical protein